MNEFVFHVLCNFEIAVQNCIKHLGFHHPNVESPTPAQAAISADSVQQNDGYAPAQGRPQALRIALRRSIAIVTFAKGRKGNSSSAQPRPTYK